jgi:hypothetical protein
MADFFLLQASSNLFESNISTSDNNPYVVLREILQKQAIWAYFGHLAVFGSLS